VTNGAEDLRLWDAVATAYTGRADNFYQRVRGFLWDRLGEISGLEALDLGCGDGWLAEEMRLAGARVTGVDGSDALLDQGRSRYPGVTFEQCDLINGLPWPGRRFDRVVAHTVLMDIPVLGRLLDDVAAALRPGGVFVFTILHPAFFSRAIVDEGIGGQRYRKVTGYLDHETRWIESFGGHRHYHRPLSWYVSQLVERGLVVTGLHEPLSIPADGTPEAEWTDYQRWFATIPTVLAISCSPR
jgi:SAM-dependent methyltransferase